MVPYLKGIHLMIDSWWQNQDKDGWKNTSTVKAKCEMPEQEKPPWFVCTVPRLRQDLEVLLNFTSSEKPPKVPVRPTGAAVCLYMFGDALGTRLGGHSGWPGKAPCTQPMVHGHKTPQTNHQISENYRM
jgi:hypothetical protein